jgi:DNA replication protein DnaC
MMDMINLDPQLRHQFCQDFLGKLAKTASDEQAARASHNKEMNDLAGINFGLYGVESGIPRVIRNFDDFKPRPEFPRVEQALTAVQDWLRGIGPGMVTLSGAVGTGKSHLATAAAQQLCIANKPVIYRLEAGLIGELQHAMKSGDPEIIIQEIVIIPWLILEEMGNGAVGDWGRGVMDRIINARWENAEGVRTLITTNLVGDEMPGRIASRLRDTQVARVVGINASDYRSHRD